MQRLVAIDVPEVHILTTAEHDLIMYSLVVAGLALFASFVRSWNGLNEVSARYRPAILASMCITGVATLSYLVLMVMFHTGYTYTGHSYRPTANALYSISPRYMDWSVSVPLLVVELLAVSALVGRKATAARGTGMAAAFAMIVTGYLGTQVFDHGSSAVWLWVWWAVSMVFFLYLYVLLVPVIKLTAGALPSGAGRTYALAGTLLLVTFVVYPIVYLIPVFFAGGAWTTTMQVAFSTADVIAKVGFGSLIHKVAKLRTAHDVLTGDDTHPEPIWINNEQLSEGLLPVQRGLDTTAPSGSAAHAVRVTTPSGRSDRAR